MEVYGGYSQAIYARSEYISTMIAAISWVPKGASKSIPAVAEPPSKGDIEDILKSGVMEKRDDSENQETDEDMDSNESQLNDEVAHALVAADALGKASKSTNPITDSITDALKDLEMDRYDEEDDGVELFGSGLGNLYYPSNDVDPYLKDNNDEDDSDEEEDTTIKPEDAVIVCARNEDDVSHLEVWILEDAKDGDLNMYVHHDIIISAFPLCTAWLDCPLKGGEKGNFVAVGTMDPAIEIWDLDVMDEIQPSTALGGVLEKKKKGKKVEDLRLILVQAVVHCCFMDRLYTAGGGFALTCAGWWIGGGGVYFSWWILE
ncbi:uncharacterized WD repeat-containing -like [Olea europaea subsp. europaea]|uniref:Uncharacterized WD repeat-containing -like n=1 Tax=Olea europaea subsp. europaea TaxID=158383 RepID=A0A8S0TJW0_OLEEU|nr:uncharacterized WD repeat-containing -like [Olea europaea subsp. europaea]